MVSRLLRRSQAGRAHRRLGIVYRCLTRGAAFTSKHGAFHSKDQITESTSCLCVRNMTRNHAPFESSEAGVRRRSAHTGVSSRLTQHRALSRPQE